MSVRVELLGADEVEDPTAWPWDTPSSVRAYLTPLVRRGPSSFLENAAGVACRVLTVGGRVAVPVLVASGAGAAKSVAAILSPRAQHLDYPIEDAAKGSRLWTERGLRLALAPLVLLFALGRLDRVVFLNHWLVGAAPRLPLTGDELTAATALLTRRFPDHALVVPYVVPALGRGEDQILRARGFRLVRSRIVFLVDMRDRRLPRKRDVRDGRRLLAAAEGVRLGGTARLSDHLSSVVRLYRDHYVGRHSVLNPRYTEDFFRLALSSGLFEGEGWASEEGGLIAFTMWLPEEDAVAVSIGAYDHALPRTRGLFRLISAWDLEGARARGVTLNWGGGNDRFKRLRGGRPAPGFEAVLDRHLPAHRRLPWSVLRALKALNERAGGVELPPPPDDSQGDGVGRRPPS